MFECPICYEKIEDDNGVVKTVCGHNLCIKCYSKYVIFTNNQSNINCPCCKGKIIDESEISKKLSKETSASLEHLKDLLFQKEIEPNISKFETISQKDDTIIHNFIFFSKIGNNNSSKRKLIYVNDEESKKKIMNRSIQKMNESVFKFIDNASCTVIRDSISSDDSIYLTRSVSKKRRLIC